MNNKKTSLSNQLIVITLTALLVMIVSIIIVLPKSLEPFFEETVYSYLDQPLQMIEKEDSLTKKYKNIAYIIYSDDRIPTPPPTIIRIKMPIFISQSPPCQCFYILMLYMMWNFASGYIVWTFGKKIKGNGWILTRYEQESLFS